MIRTGGPRLRSANECDARQHVSQNGVRRSLRDFVILLRALAGRERVAYIETVSVTALLLGASLGGSSPPAALAIQAHE
jgi:hypothetical protein